MSGPWEKYGAMPAADATIDSPATAATPAGPWAKYQTPAAAPSQATPALPETAKPEAAKPAGLSMTSDIHGDALPQRTTSFLKGLRDPIDGGAQLLTKILPESVVQAGNAANNWLADKTGLVGKLPPGGVDQQVREGEQAYQQTRAANGESGFDGNRILGNILNPVNFSLATAMPKAASLIGRIGTSAATGAASSALAPVNSEDFAGEKIKQVGMGAALGGAAPVVTGAIARLVSPRASTDANLKLLKDEGVQTTIGQTLGGRWNALEEKLQSVPILGDMISVARGKAREQFNTAAINRATAPVGVKVPGSGQDAVKQAGDALGTAYQKALAQVQHVPFDPQFHGQLAQLQGMAQSLVPGMGAKFSKTLNDVVLGRVGPQGSMLGSVYKDVDSELGQIAARYGKSPMASEAEFGDAVAQLQNLLKQQMMRTNPAVARQLQAADLGWANLVRVEGAAKAAHNAEGVFTPGQLNAAIRAADDSTRGRAVARGTALMQDLGNAGQTVLGNKVPNSGTADRAFANIGALASGAISPAIPASLIAGGATYTGPIQSLLRSAVSARPQMAQPAAEAVRKITPLLVPLSTGLGLGLAKE